MIYHDNRWVAWVWGIPLGLPEVTGNSSCVLSDLRPVFSPLEVLQGDRCNNSLLARMSEARVPGGNLAISQPTVMQLIAEYSG